MKIPGGAILRVCAVIAHALLGVGIALASPPNGLTQTVRGRRIVTWWHARLLTILGLRINVFGTPAPAPVLVVANHISWVDIAAIGASVPAHFVAKSEIRSWPVIGWLAAQAGTIYIKRGDRSASAAVETGMVTVLKQNESIVLFPEGTSTNGLTVQSFHARLFASAIKAGVLVQPVALRYPDVHNHIHPAAPFIGQDTLVHHLWRLVRARGDMRVEVHFLPVESSQNVSARTLATQARLAILRCTQNNA